MFNERKSINLLYVKHDNFCYLIVKKEMHYYDSFNNIKLPKIKERYNNKKT